MLKGEACQNVVTTIIKTLPIARSDKIEKKIPPQPISKPNKQPPALPSVKPVVITPKPLLKPKIKSSQPNRIEKQQRATKCKTVVGTFSLSRIIKLDIKFSSIIL